MQRAAALVALFQREGGPQPDDWRALSATIGEAVARGQQGFLFALHEAVLPHRLLQGWPAQSSFRAAGLIPEAAALRTFLERAKTPPVTELPRPQAPRLTDLPARSLGALLAYAQPDTLLERELEWFGAEPALQALFACWIQERIARGSDIGRSPFVERFWTSLVHPLAALPLRLLAMEENLVGTPVHTGDTLGNWFTFPMLRIAPFSLPEGPWRAPWTPLEADPAEVCAVMADPGLAPNATLEARVVQLSARPPALEAMSLQQFGLECLLDAPAKVSRVSAREVMAVLVCLGTTGGAYAEARSAAYGRLLAWRSLRALTGAGPELTLAQLEARAEACQWLQFESDSRWFNHISFDVGLVCLRPDSTVAVAAMTDTD